uniref:FAD dependent oxidoreductase domain-containing protein n=2 Tax=Emiliania huxleyi TaxID=2903 RepID=A0A7S3TG05_EMIHU
MSAQQMGMELLSKARDAGAATLIPSSLQGVRTASDGQVEAALLSVPGESEPLEVRTGAVVNAAGPYAGVVDALLRGGGGEGGGGRELPLQNEVHAKAVLRDDLSAVPGDAPMVVWTDPVTLPWSEEEAEALLEIGGFEASLAGSLPGGFHLRPYPGKPHSLLMLWEAIHADVAVPREPPEEVGLRRERTRQRARGEENGGAAGAEGARHGTARILPHSLVHTCTVHTAGALHCIAQHRIALGLRRSLSAALAQGAWGRVSWRWSTRRSCAVRCSPSSPCGRCRVQCRRSGATWARTAR